MGMTLGEWRHLEKILPGCFDRPILGPLDYDCEICGAQVGMPCERHGTILRQPHIERGTETKPRRYYDWYISGRKHKRRKGKYLKGVPWTSRNKTTRRQANRKARHLERIEG